MEETITREFVFNDGTSETKTFDLKGNVIYSKHSKGFEYWYGYDKNDNVIHYKNSNGEEYWVEYSLGKEVFFEHSNGYKRWTEYSEEGKRIYSRDSIGGQRWYNSKEEIIHEKFSSGSDILYEYDDNDTLIREYIYKMVGNRIVNYQVKEF